MAPAVDRWVERFDAWVEGRVKADSETEIFLDDTPPTRPAAIVRLGGAGVNGGLVRFPPPQLV